MKAIENLSVLFSVIGLIIIFMASFTGLNTGFQDSEINGYILFFSVIGAWIFFSGWSSYALAGKGYKRGLHLALGFLALIGVIIAYLVPSKRELHLGIKYDNLEKINNLRKNGVITDDEYKVEKVKILSV